MDSTAGAVGVVGILLTIIGIIAFVLAPFMLYFINDKLARQNKIIDNMHRNMITGFNEQTELLKEIKELIRMVCDKQ